MKKSAQTLTSLLLVLLLSSFTAADIPTKAKVYSVIEITFNGPNQTAKDTPSRDIDFWVRFQHENQSLEKKIHGFFDGDGKGGAEGDVFKIRFCPTKPGKWTLVEVHSNVKELSRQHQGNEIIVEPSNHPGFWITDPNSEGQRWYQRSDGSHPYIVGNTHYSFLSGYEKGNSPSENDIAKDIQGNAKYFKKLRMGLSGDHYPNPEEKPFLDTNGTPTDWGDHSHHPNPRWFHQRVDRAVQTAYECDLITDLILAGPDREESRSTLRAKENNGDATPFLRYIAARYGSYPNVWICLCNEYEIKNPKYIEKEIAEWGQTIHSFLPYSTPLSVHSTPRTLWSEEFENLPPWNDHQIIQKKIRKLAPAADVLYNTWKNPNGKGPLYKPTINDELSYQGQGDKHTEGDTIESHLGIFLGGGYGSTGEKPGNKTGQYFRGKFNPKEHSAADNLKWLSDIIEENITFWKMAPDTSIFKNIDEGFRPLAWPDHEYVLGTNKQWKKITANLPTGTWTVTQYDIINMKKMVVSKRATGTFTFDAPASRAVLFHFKKK